MCVICVKPKNIKVAKHVLKTCYRNNPDGAGFAYPNKKAVVIEKGFFSFRSFWKRYRVIQSLNYPMLIHFRIATSGKIDGKNCHPWRIDLEHAMVHNGTLIPKENLECQECSDTGYFVQKILTPTFKDSKGLWREESYKWLLENSIGKNNKIAILDKNGNIEIYNESEGEWSGGAWFSNKTYYKDRKIYKKQQTNVIINNATNKPLSKIVTSPTFNSSQRSILTRNLHSESIYLI